MSKPKICVLMSTYNGEKYIREQIDSILKQIDVDVSLLIRDDGSKDNTISICRNYEKRYANISFYSGENIGVGRSFLELLTKAPEADFYSFADQDDVWIENKLIRAVCVIKRVENLDVSSKIGSGYPIICSELGAEKAASNMLDIPILYGSNLLKVDENLNMIGLRFEDTPKCDLLSCLSRNIIYGCTMMMNRQLRKVFIRVGFPSSTVLDRKNHDGWLLYLAYISGVFVYDPNSYIQYREHPNQVVGAKEIHGVKLFQMRISRLKSKKNKKVRSILAKELREKLSDYINNDTEAHLEILSNANSLNGVIKLIKDKTLVDSFNEKKIMVILRGLFGWI